MTSPSAATSTDDYIGGAARLCAGTSLKLESGDIWFNAPSQAVTPGVREGIGLAAVLGPAARGLPWNLAFEGDADFLGYATTLIGKMAADVALQEQAHANDTVEAFGNGAYKTKLNNAVVDALDGHSAMADQALRHPKVFKGLAELLVDEVYRQLRSAPGPQRVAP